MRKTQYNQSKGLVELAEGSITRYPADALVCPANGDLEMVAFPGGVQYAFFVEGGEEIFKDAVKVSAAYMFAHPEMVGDIGRVPELSAHLTVPGRLPTKHVIHSVAVGIDKTRQRTYCNPEIVAKSTRNVLKLAAEHKLTSIGFPALGTGLYDVPLDRSVGAMLEEFDNHLKQSTSVERIGLVLYGAPAYKTAIETANAKFNPKERR